MDLSGELARTLLDLAPDPTVIVDAEGTIVFANAQVEHAFGYGPAELVGARVEALLPERFRDGHPGHRERFASHAKPRPMGAGGTLYGRHKDGHEFPDRDQPEPRRDGRRPARRRGRSRRYAAARQRRPARRREQAEEPVPRGREPRPAPAAPDAEPAESRGEAPSRRERLHARPARAAAARARLDVRVARVRARHQQARQRRRDGEPDGLRDRRDTRDGCDPTSSRRRRKKVSSSSSSDRRKACKPIPSCCVACSGISFRTRSVTRSAGKSESPAPAAAIWSRSTFVIRASEYRPISSSGSSRSSTKSTAARSAPRASASVYRSCGGCSSCSAAACRSSPSSARARRFA